MKGDCLDCDFRPASSFSDKYEVCPHGTVRRLGTGALLSPYLDDAGRPCLHVHTTGGKRHVKVSWLVADAWIGPRPNKRTVLRHLDGNPANNNVGNLAYGTQSENQADAVRHGTHYNAQKTHCPRGHRYTPENTTPPTGRQGRKCRTCRREDARRRKLRVA